MTGKAAGAWNKPPIKLPQKKDNTSFPGLAPASASSPEIATKVEYEERQRDEVLALEAIYGEDFVKHTQTHSVWKKSEPSFDIRIRAPSNDDIAVTLGVVLTATYPKSPPLLTLKDLGDIRDATQFKVQKYIEKQPPILALEGQEMVDQIVEGIREILEDAAQSKARGLELPSLEQERAIHEAEQAKLAQEQRALDERKKAEEVKESERVLSGLIQEHVKRQQDLAKESRKKNRASGAPIPIMANSKGQEDAQIIFDRPCRTTDSNGNEVSFQAVADKREVARGTQTTVFSVRPIVATGHECPVLALKQTQIKTAGKDKAQIKKQIQALEPLLETLKSVRHKNIVDLVDFRLEGEFEPGDGKNPSMWNLTILTPLSNKGSLEELLDLAGTLELNKVRTWTRDLLEALTFLHNKSITHQDIHPGNILLFKESTGEIVPKLADAGYQKELHGMFAQGRAPPGLGQATTAYWLPPEIAATSRPSYTHKTDVWEFGIVVAQMLFGREVTRRFQSPAAFVEATNLSKSLRELITRFFKQDPKKRPRAFELTSSEFLATDAPAVTEDSVGIMEYSSSLTHSTQMTPRLRRESTNKYTVSSRYQEDFVEEGRLGKGGFGEVVKARKKLDGQIYAIKKVSQRSHTSLTEILKEVRLLAKLSHPAVVRYYNTWVEELPETSEGDSDDDDDATESGMGVTASRTDGKDDDAEDNSGLDIQFAASTTGGLDYMSYQAEDDDGGIMFTNDISDLDGEDDSSDSEEETTSNPASPLTQRNGMGGRRRSGRTMRTILYISMEYCEKRTLRDLIQRKLYQNGPELWRIFRQILEGLVHIHSLSIVHRDLKPENIFIAHSADGTDNIKIGDFGLATSGRIAAEKGIANALESDEITRSIGTASYAAPEVRSASSISYNDKVDMYSLGVIFFEMSYPAVTGMHRADIIGKLRRSPPVLPADFKPVDKVQTEIVLQLLEHNPKNRPSSSELLQSGKLPVQMESETIRRTLDGLSDPKSPFYAKMLSTLFARPNDQTTDYTWDMPQKPCSTPLKTLAEGEILKQNIVKKTLISIFRRHGALETTRSGLYPRSAHYGDNVVKLLDTSGTVLQLPYDLTMGNARALAKQSGPVLQRSFTFGSVFRDRLDSTQPNMFGEVDFDIVTTDTLDLALKEAEVIKVLDEIISTFPSLSSAQMYFQIGHSLLLQLIFEYCRVEPSARRPAADVLSKLNNYGFTWQKIRTELRSPLVGASATSIDELQRFDWRDTPSKAFARLKTLFEGTDMYQRAASTLAHLREVYEYAKRLGVARKIYVSPLNSLKESFYTGGILFSCIYDKKQRDVFAAGGRYDSLIKEHRPRIGVHHEERHAVGFSLAWERLARVAASKTGGKAFLKKTEEEPHSLFNARRCDVLVASFDAAVLRSTGVEILQTLWAQDISAELARDARSPEDLLSKYRDDNHSWIIIIKQDSILKMKSMHNKDIPDADIPLTQLTSWLRGEIREREQRAGIRPHATQHASQHTTENHHHPEQDVHVLVAQTKSKKFNRRTVVEQAQVSAASLVQSFLEGPILAVETTDQVVEGIRETSLSDAESWRRLEQAVNNAERKYIRDVHQELDEFRDAWRVKGGSRHAFLYNFRTGNCVYYDLGG